MFLCMQIIAQHKDYVLLACYNVIMAVIIASIGVS